MEQRASCSSSARTLTREQIIQVEIDCRCGWASESAKIRGGDRRVIRINGDDAHELVFATNNPLPRRIDSGNFFRELVELSEVCVKRLPRVHVASFDWMDFYAHFLMASRSKTTGSLSNSSDLSDSGVGHSSLY